MTVFRQSKCQWCNGELYTWWDRFLDGKLAERFFWGSWFSLQYLRLLPWSGRVSKMWHRRFHEHRVRYFG